jgi:cytochrome c556
MRQPCRVQGLEMGIERMSPFVRVSRPGALFLTAIAVFVCAAGQAIRAEARQSAAPGAAATSNALQPPAPKALDPAEAEGIIFERQQIMKQLDDDANTMGSIVAGEIPPTKMAETARSVAKGAREAYEAFKQNVPGGRAKPEVWSSWPDYSARMESFVKNSEAMSKVADTGNVTAVTSMLGEALPCKECHTVYRVPKQP